MQAGFWRRHRWLKWVGGGLLVAFAVLTGAVLTLAHRAEPIVRAYIVQGLQDHFHARVELDSFHLTLRNGLWAEGNGLRIWPPAAFCRPTDSADTARRVPVSCTAGLQVRAGDSHFGCATEGAGRGHATAAAL
jgi:hypothetical protein